MEEKERGPRSGELEAEIAQVCGVMNAATARLVRLIAEVLERETWQVNGIHSPSQWVAWQCGVSPSRARSLVAMARRRAELRQPAPDSPPEETRTVSFGHTPSGSWRLSAELPADEGALVERALVAARDELFRAGAGEPGTRGNADQAPRA